MKRDVGKLAVVYEVESGQWGCGQGSRGHPGWANHDILS